MVHKIYSKYIVAILFYIAISFTSITVCQCQRNIENKIKGISFLGPQDTILELAMVQSVDKINATWIAAVPEATLDRGTLLLISDRNNDNWSETMEGVTRLIKLAKRSNKRVMLKPQVILAKNIIPNELFNELASYLDFNYKEITDKTYGAKWRGDFVAGTEKDWKQWESSYEQYILNYARLAQELNIDLFCIGTELREFVIRRPKFWKALIFKIRRLYDGPLTYSANWDEYDKVPFWEDLDFIGTNTYFPISNDALPSIDVVLNSWRNIRSEIRKVSQRVNKKVIITEYGYRNISYAGQHPWVHDDGKPIPPNYKAQVNLYEAFFKAFWNESWIMGGFGWNWLYVEQSDGNTDFSVQGKPAIEVVTKYYEKDN